MKLRLSKIHDAAAHRPSGYVAAVIARGVVEGEYLEISSEALAELRDIYRPRIEPALPPVTVQFANAFAAAAAEVRLRHRPAVDPDEAARRFAICGDCDYFRHSDQRCSLCGCYMRFKTRLRSQNCPVGKW